MKKGFNLQLLEFKNRLINDINESGMPISVTVMVIDSLLAEIKRQETVTIQNESDAYNKSVLEEQKRQVAQDAREEVQKEINELNKLNKERTNQNGGNE